MSAAQVQPVSSEPESRETTGAIQDRVNILLVDDRAENLRVLEAILEPLGQTLIHASSGEEALRELLLRDFAVILLDVQMPGMNGLETARYVKSRPRTRTIPIIFLTAINQDDSHVFRAYEVGAVDYLFKPFDPEILRSKVSVFVDLWRQQQQIKRQEETIREAQRRELELQHRARILETEARTAAELSSLNTALSKRTAEMERAIAARNRFYASMSHELRTPINAVLGYSTLLLDNIYGPLTPQQREGLERTHRAAKHLLELVNDVLDLSKIEAGKIELAVQSVGFPSLIDDLFVTVRPLAAESATELVLDALSEPVSIQTDPRRVRQILLNLLSNAIKFGNRKPVRVEYRQAADGGVQVSVVDQGGGIAPGDLARIFDEFVQVAGEDQRHQRGTGLGLAISRRLAELLDGTLEVESTPGVGSRFCLTLPPSVNPGGSEGGRTGR
ncbi:MAG TPA: ATP-binding protein [Gemmatimonadaceae bacterium]|nr:ATP-binding protein [Gemmatimonadaceae bacterium]